VTAVALPTSASPTRDAAPAIPVRAAQLGKTIDDRPILNAIDLDLESGGFLALLGANGAGKSTLLKVLATLTGPTSGRLAMFGHTLFDAQAHSRSASSAATKIRARIGLISHQTMLYHDLSARENLVFSGKLYGIPQPRLHADELLARFGLADRADDPVKSFSRGMMQRVAIARALLHDPALLLADEPFAGLDAPSAALLEATLAQLHQAGKTIILVNHDIVQSLRLAQRVVVLRRGRKIIDAASAALDERTVLQEMST
jgi:ABC-type multidrug transport system ATPase subunit